MDAADVAKRHFPCKEKSKGSATSPRGSSVALGVAVALQIRSAELGDSAAVAAILNELGYPSDERAAALRIEQASGCTGRGALVAVEADAILGLIAYEDMYYLPSHATICRITALVVSSTARRRGLANLLVDAVIEQAFFRDCARIEVTTSTGRDDARAFYEAAGFEMTSYVYVRDATLQGRDA